MKKLIASAVLAGVLSLPVAFAQPKKPMSVIHVINVKFKSDASKADIDKALNGVAEMNYPGLTNVWLKPIKNQLSDQFTHIIVMEFASKEALDKYTGSDAQKKWYETYMKVRDESRTNDITN
jgi:antibiotic biosynthesis monooxygenase (ABM) superfamily enzyme